MAPLTNPNFGLVLVGRSYFFRERVSDETEERVESAEVTNISEEMFPVDSREMSERGVLPIVGRCGPVLWGPLGVESIVDSTGSMGII